MTGIYEILAKSGIEIPEEKKKDFEKDLFDNYKSVAEMSKKDERIANLTEQLNTTKESLKAFEGVNAEELRGQIAKLTNDLSAKDTEYQNKIASMEFDYLMDGAISKAKGRNPKAIKALLDMEALRTSNNRGEDISKAIEGLKAENDYLFETESAPARYSSGTGTGARSGGEGKTTPQFF